MGEKKNEKRKTLKDIRGSFCFVSAALPVMEVVAVCLGRMWCFIQGMTLSWRAILLGDICTRQLNICQPRLIKYSDHCRAPYCTQVNFEDRTRLSLLSTDVPK